LSNSPRKPSALSAYLDRLRPPADDCRKTEPFKPPSIAIGFWSELHSASLLWRACALVAAHGLETLLFLVSWACIGSGALSGRLDHGWLAAWALTLGSMVPLRAVSTWLQGVVAVGFGGLLRQRLLAGVMATDPDAVHRRGAGAMMSEVLESEALDDFGAGGGLTTLLALVELWVAPLLFAWGAAPVAEAATFLGWMVLSLAWVRRNVRLRTEWTYRRIGLTNRLLENMTAHRTRLAQQAPADRHTADDDEIAEYLSASRRLDDGGVRIEAALPRGYVIAGFLALAPSFIAGTVTLTQLAITLGTVLFAGAALQRVCFGVSQTAAAWIAWRMVKPMFDAATLIATDPGADDFQMVSTPVLQALEVGFIYPNGRDRVLARCTLRVEPGDQILLEGAAGSGKSTFASILAGSRDASEGVVLIGGIDRPTLGNAAWRRHIALAPQYHENHILAAPLILNLLMGRSYPHTAGDIEEASVLCGELGLGPLIQRMPSGLNQFVGDTGWCLSQGERSRIYLARALLQKAQIVVLDESLAALDPENLRQCLDCVKRRAPTLFLIAHP
jgi:ATP-binding cassette subfamily B protein